MRVNVSSLCLGFISYAHKKCLGSRDSQGYWQDGPGGSDGRAQGDEELHVKSSQAIEIDVHHIPIPPRC